jgi:mono/diheme cytochrome c family protein
VRKRVNAATLEAMIVLGVLTVALIGATAGISVWLVNAHDDQAAAAATETVEEVGATEETTADTGGATAATEAATATESQTETQTQAETAATEGETAASGQGDATAGKEVFLTAGCADCHTLADAGSTGTVGPNLDEASPSADKGVERVTDGQGAMPSFKDVLSEQQIADVAAYVSQATEGD